jgi:uncharacterized protein YdhG (YjbR/CyaY superfamily)
MPAATVDEYLAALPPEQRDALEALRNQIRAIVPGVEEFMSYGVIGFRQGKVLCHIGAAKSHCALYGVHNAAEHPELAGFKTSTGTIRFQPGNPLPATLVERLVRSRVAEIEAARATKKPASR